MITCDGKPVLEMRLTLPRSGAWVAELELDAEEAPTGTVQLADDATTLTGTVRRAGVLAETCRLDLVGGRGGLPTVLEAKSYVGVSARSVVADILAGAGESLDPRSSASMLGAILPYWTRAREPAGRALATLVADLGGFYRALPAGTFWIGSETWPAAPKETEIQELDRDDAAQNVVLGLEAMLLFPGMLHDGRQVGRVEYSVGRSSPFRTTYWVVP